MRIEQFVTLEAEDRVRFERGHVVIEGPIKNVERWGVRPGVKETSSITLYTGNRMKVDDVDVQYLTLIHRHSGELLCWPCIYNNRIARTNIVVGPLMTHSEAMDYCRKHYRLAFQVLEAGPCYETEEAELDFNRWDTEQQLKDLADHG